ncbi:MAG TPA: amidase [Methylomirabilota bacterium]|nr:amidase [Methylomirabilota bacterium]
MRMLSRIVIVACVVAVLPTAVSGAESGVEALVAEASVADLQELMADGTLTSEAIAVALIGRIERLDGALRSILAVNPEAVAQARTLDAERREGTVRGPLHGIPVLLKDNIESADPLPTTAGSLVLATNITGRDAGLVGRLRAAGAVVLGKTNLSEWANFRSERSSSGWSAVGGQTRNPYDPARSPCGSSSGSGAAVAAGFAPAAVGTETDGSIVCPATATGLVGIKPTVGLVSRFGIVPISHTQDTAGPMARTVADAVALLEVMIGTDPRDPATELAARAADWSLASHLRPDGLQGKRLGVLRSHAGFHEGVNALLDRAIADLEAAGATVVDGLELTGPEGVDDAEYRVLLVEFRHDLDAYLAGLPGADRLPATSLEALIAFNERHASVEMPWFGQDVFLKSRDAGSLDDEAYRQALELSRDGSRRAIDGLLAEHDLDALVAPTGSPAWTIDPVNGDHFLGGSSSYPARAGYPNVTVPMGEVHGLPVGVSFFATALAEPTLVEIASAYEQATQRRRPPRLE